MLKPFQDAYFSTLQRVLVFYLMMHRLSVNKSGMSEDEYRLIRAVKERFHVGAHRLIFSR